MSDDNGENLVETIVKSDEYSLSDYNEENKKLEPLLEEIEMINDKGVRFFVRAVLLKADKFWLIPSSFSGKYHPPDERMSGGNVLHTQRVFRIANMICDAYPIEGMDRDLILAAALIHDVTKGRTWENGEVHYDPMHPYTVGKFVEKIHENDKNYASESQSSTLYISEEYMNGILRLVRCHLGKWSPVPETVPYTTHDMILHLADLIASKLHLVIDGEDYLEERWFDQQQ